MTMHGRRLLLPSLVTAAVLAGCAVPFKKKPPAPPAAPPVTIAAPAETKTKASMTLAAERNVNPDRSGRPSPVQVRVYQLKAAMAFQDSQFDPLYDDDKKVLGEAFVTRDDFTLAPGEKKTLEVSLAADTRFVGVVAVFRDVFDKDSQWHAVAPAPRKNLLVTLTGKRVSLMGTE
jgi:type VI secretion system protein VasD